MTFSVWLDVIAASLGSGLVLLERRSAIKMVSQYGKQQTGVSYRLPGFRE